MKIRPTKYIEKLKPYEVTSHKVWEYIYNNSKRVDEVIKLDWNESTKFDNFIIKKILRYFIKHRIRLNWYPDTDNKILRKKISEYVGCHEENVQYFGGSDAALEYIARTFLSSGDKVGIISPTYDNFRVYAESCGAKIINIFHQNPFKKDIYYLTKQIEKNKYCKMVYMANPNNPTGILYNKKEIAHLLNKFKKTLFIIDEAYYEFCGETCVELIKQYDNIIITRSFTKAFGLGGFRLGYIVAPKYIIKNIDKIRVGKNVNIFAQIAGIVALENKHYMEQYVSEVKKVKEKVYNELKKMGFEVIDTPANFILIRVKNPQKLVKKLEANNIFVRDRSSYPQLDGCIRITIGDYKTMKNFLARLRRLL